jgi:hypothetical protein
VQPFIDSPAWPYTFTIGFVLLWLQTAWWTWRVRRYLFFVLLIATAYCFWSEFGAIHVGTYFYDRLLTYAPGGGGGFDFQKIVAWIDGTIPSGINPCGRPPSYRIPVGIMAMEGVLLVTIFRTTHMLSPRWYVAPFLDGLVALNLDAFLDPIAAHTVYCGNTSGPVFNGLSFWIWQSNDTNLGYWFGIPLVNYLAWFLNVFAFSLVIRFVAHVFHINLLGNPTADIPRRVHNVPSAPGDHGTIGKDLPAAVVALVVLLLVEVGLSLPLRKIFYVSPTAVWQGGFMVALIAVSVAVVVVFRQPLTRDWPFEWRLPLPQIFTFAFCFCALIVTLWPSRAGVLVIAIGATLLGLLFALSPFKGTWELLGRLLGRHPPGGP